MLPDVIPREFVEDENDWFPMLPDVIPKEFVEYEKDWFPMFPDVIPKEFVEDENDCPPIVPFVIPSEFVDQLSAKVKPVENNMQEIKVSIIFFNFILVIISFKLSKQIEIFFCQLPQL